MDRKTRICLWVIVLGLGNFMAFTILYMFIGGEAINGWVESHNGHLKYVLQSQHSVSRDVFIYSGIHSISIWLTVAAIMLAMLTLAKERIVSSMRATIVRGRTFITILATVITLTSVVITLWFILQFSARLSHPRVVSVELKAAVRAALPRAAVDPIVAAASQPATTPSLAAPTTIQSERP